MIIDEANKIALGFQGLQTQSGNQLPESQNFVQKLRSQYSILIK